MSLQHNKIAYWAYKYVHDWCFEGHLRERERERGFTVDEKKNEEDETKIEKQVEEGEGRGEIKMINYVDMVKVEKKEKKK